MKVQQQHGVARFYELVWPHRAAVLRMARILVGNAADADDLAQETLMKAFGSIESFDGRNPRAWLMTILRHARIDKLRLKEAGVRSVSIETVDPAAPEDSVESPFDAWENPDEVLDAFSDEQVISALQRLPEDLRLSLLLVDVEQMSLADAAELLDVPLGTMKSRTHRGRSMLRQALTPLARQMRLIP